FVFARRDKQRRLTSRILAFSVANPTKEMTGPVRNPLGYLMSLAGTVTDGAGKIQGELQPAIHRIEIDANGIEATDFDRVDEEAITGLIGNGKAAAKKFFDEEVLQMRPRRSLDTVCTDRDELFARAA